MFALRELQSDRVPEAMNATAVTMARAATMTHSAVSWRKKRVLDENMVVGCERNWPFVVGSRPVIYRRCLECNSRKTFRLSSRA